MSTNPWWRMVEPAAVARQHILRGGSIALEFLGRIDLHELDLDPARVVVEEGDMALGMATPQALHPRRWIGPQPAQRGNGYKAARAASTSATEGHVLDADDMRAL